MGWARWRVDGKEKVHLGEIGLRETADEQIDGEASRAFEVGTHAGERGLRRLADGRLVVDANDGDVVRNAQAGGATGVEHDGGDIVVRGKESTGLRQLEKPGLEPRDEVCGIAHRPRVEEGRAVLAERSERFAEGFVAICTPVDIARPADEGEMFDPSAEEHLDSAFGDARVVVPDGEGGLRGEDLRIRVDMDDGQFLQEGTGRADMGRAFDQTADGLPEGERLRQRHLHPRELHDLNLQVVFGGSGPCPAQRRDARAGTEVGKKQDGVHTANCIKIPL